MNYEELKQLLNEYRPAMSAGERMDGYMSGKEVDCQPHMFLSADFAFANIFGYTAKQYLDDPDVQIDVLKRKRDEFDQNSLDIALGLKSMGAAFGSKLTQPENASDFIEDHILKDYADLDDLTVPDPYDNPVLCKIFNRARQVKAALPDYAFVTSLAGPLTTAISIRPIEYILRDTRKRPDKLHKLLEMVVDGNLAWIKALKAEFGVLPVSFADPAVCSDILSDRQFDEFNMPHFKRMIDGIKEIMGKYPGGHICGSSHKLWRRLADAGVPSFSIDNCEDLEHAKAAFGDNMMLMGNVPPVDVIKNGTIDEVIEACKECLRKGADNPKGFILMSGCQVPIGTPRENIEAFLYAARKYGRAAQIGKLPKGILEEA